MIGQADRSSGKLLEMVASGQRKPVEAGRLDQSLLGEPREWGLTVFARQRPRQSAISSRFKKALIGWPARRDARRDAAGSIQTRCV
jgi:hypothetical protein